MRRLALIITVPIVIALVASFLFPHPWWSVVMPAILMVYAAFFFYMAWIPREQPPKEMKKPDEIPDSGDLMSLEVFVKSARHGLLSPDDGDGYYATDRWMDRDAQLWSCKRPEWATHVVWFNK